MGHRGKRSSYAEERFLVELTPSRHARSRIRELIATFGLNYFEQRSPSRRQRQRNTPKVKKMKVETKYLQHSRLPEADVVLAYTLPWRPEGWKKSDTDRLYEMFLTNVPRDGFVVNAR